MLYDRKGLRVFVYTETIDMRFGFERLHSYCVNHLNARMDQGHLYVFFGKNRRRLKVLWYDGSGLVLATKRIEKGSFMSLNNLLGRTELSQEEFKMILHGSVIKHPTVERPVVNKYPVTQREPLDKGNKNIHYPPHAYGKREKTFKRSTSRDHRSPY